MILKYTQLFGFIFLLFLSACSDGDDKQPQDTSGDAIWFDHFDGGSSWTSGSTTFDALPGGWQKAGKWANGTPFLNIWLTGHVEVPYNGSYMRLRLDEKDDNCSACLPNNFNCTVNSNLYVYASGEYRTNKKFGYGVFEVRMKSHSLSGTVASFFLYCDKPEPNGSWSKIPEIDWEFFNGEAQVNFYDRGSSYNVAMIDPGFDITADYHVYGIRWMPDDDDLNDDKSLVSWYIDGKLVYGPVTVNFGEGDSLKVMMNLWPVDNSIWSNPGLFNPAAGDLPVYAQYDWVGYIPKKILEDNLNGINSFIPFFGKK